MKLAITGISSVLSFTLGVGAVATDAPSDPTGLGDWVVMLLDRFGTPIAFLAVGVLLAWKFGKILTPHIITWLRAQVEMSNVVRDAFPRIERSIDDIARHSEKVPDKLESLERKADDAARKLDRLVDRAGPGK